MLPSPSHSLLIVTIPPSLSYSFPFLFIFISILGLQSKTEKKVQRRLCLPQSAMFLIGRIHDVRRSLVEIYGVKKKKKQLDWLKLMLVLVGSP